MSNVLVLYSFLKKEWKDAFLIDENGRHEKTSCITTGSQTSVFKACSVPWKNDYYIFGGEGDDPRAIVKLSGKSLTRVGNLAFDLHWGSCNNIKDEQLFLFPVSKVKSFSFGLV